MPLHLSWSKARVVSTRIQCLLLILMHLKSHSLYSDNCSRLGLLFWTFSNSFPNVLSFLFWCKNNSSLIRTGRGQVDTQKSNCFQNIYNPPQKNCKTKKPLHTSGNRNKRGRNFLSALIFCFKPKICNGFELKPLLFLFLSVRTETYFIGELCKFVVF